MKNVKVNYESLISGVTGTIDYGDVIHELKYNLYPLAGFVFEEMDDESLAGYGINDIESSLRETQKNLSQLYIKILELIAKRDISINSLSAQRDDYTLIPNQLDFLGKLADAFGNITVELNKLKEEKAA